MSTELLPRYVHSHIDADHIRLLNLQPSADGDPLQCTLQTVSILSPGQYEALSYCWGTGQQSEQLICQDSVISITPDLSDALKYLRRPDYPQTLWIDQICIDQRSDEDKASQVQLMRAIYSRADHVLVYLGREDSETELAFRLINQIGDNAICTMKSKEGGTVFAGDETLPWLPPRDAPEWAAYHNLLRRPWFTRVWTYQEIVLSKKASVLCGNHIVRWNRFAVAYSTLSTMSESLPGHESYLIDDSQILKHMIFGRRLHQTNPNNSEHSSTNEPSANDYRISHELLSLVSNLRRNQATDPRDKVYALLGVANDLNTSVPQVDYTTHFRIIFANYSKWFITRYHDLSVLKLVSLHPYLPVPTQTCANLPSWVPDFRSYDFFNNLRLHEGPKYFSHGSRRLYNATGSSYASVRDSQPLQLTLEGIYVGNIVKLCEPAGNLVGNTAIGPRVLTGGQWSQIAANFCSASGIYEPTSEPIEIAYQRLRVADYLPGERNADERHARKRPVVSLPEPGSISFSSNGDALIHAAANDIGRLILKATTRQRFYITDSGYMGICHRSCILGDQVYLLMGGDMPFIIRRLATGTFHFKGETYVHGIMDGEYLLKLRKARVVGEERMADVEWLDSLKDGPLPFEISRVTLS